MENSFNSSSEATVPILKSIFKKPVNITQDFEVSNDESVTAVPSNRSDLDLDTTSGDNALPFKKTRKSIQSGFDVSSEESVVNSETEKSVTFVKPKEVFTKERKSLIDFFNVSYNETNASAQPDDTGRSIDESNVVVRNPFKRSEVHNEVSVQNESTLPNEVSVQNESTLPNEVSVQNEFTLPNEVSVQNESTLPNESAAQNESPRPESTCLEADSTTFVTKENPFKKQQTDTEFTLTGNKDQTETDSRVNDELDSEIVTKSNPFKPSESQNNASISITEQESPSTVENVENPDQSIKNISINRSVSQLTNKSTSFLDQSSVNNENLDNWMSDQSDEEMPPPRTPTVTANLSSTKEKPPIPNSPAAETNKLSTWEQKLNEIVSNAERKSKAAKSKTTSPPKPKPLKKTNQNSENKVAKYKPPKLIKPAQFVTKSMYDYIIKRLEPKYGIDTVLESENLVMSICDTVKKVCRRKTHQKRLIQNLKKEMAEAGLIKTTMDFYEFVAKFLPYSFRVKVVPCLQPITNVVFPPKDGLSPFDMIL